MTAWVFAVGRMLGLGNLAGVRPSLTIATVAIVSRLGWGPGLNDTFEFLGYWLVIVAFVVLALVESSFDKIPKLDRLHGRLTMPYRLVVGGVAGAATAPFGWRGIAVGAAVGAGGAWCSQYVKGLSRPRTVTSDNVLTLLSLLEDLAAFVGTLLTLVVAPIGYAVAAFTGLVFWRQRHRRRAKYRDLRGGRA